MPQSTQPSASASSVKVFRNGQRRRVGIAYFQSEQNEDRWVAFCRRLRELLAERLPGIEIGNPTQLTYIDVDGDVILVSSTAELEEGLRHTAPVSAFNVRDATNSPASSVLSSTAAAADDVSCRRFLTRPQTIDRSSCRFPPTHHLPVVGISSAVPRPSLSPFVGLRRPHGAQMGVWGQPTTQQQTPQSSPGPSIPAALDWLRSTAEILQRPQPFENLFDLPFVQQRSEETQSGGEKLADGEPENSATISSTNSWVDTPIAVDVECGGEAGSSMGNDEGENTNPQTHTAAEQSGSVVDSERNEQQFGAHQTEKDATTNPALPPTVVVESGVVDGPEEAINEDAQRTNNTNTTQESQSPVSGPPTSRYVPHSPSSIVSQSPSSVTTSFFSPNSFAQQGGSMVSANTQGSSSSSSASHTSPQSTSTQLTPHRSIREASLRQMADEYRAQRSSKGLFSPLPSQPQLPLLRLGLLAGTSAASAANSHRGYQYGAYSETNSNASSSRHRQVKRAMPGSRVSVGGRSSPLSHAAFARTPSASTDGVKSENGLFGSACAEGVPRAQPIQRSWTVSSLCTDDDEEVIYEWDEFANMPSARGDGMREALSQTVIHTVGATVPPLRLNGQAASIIGDTAEAAQQAEDDLGSWDGGSIQDSARSAGSWSMFCSEDGQSTRN